MQSDRDASRLSNTLAALTGWLFLAAGIALLAATVLIPAHEELDRARLMQTKAAAQVQLRRDMQEDAGLRIAALTEPSDALLTSLAQTHLNLAPIGSRPIDLPNYSLAHQTRLVANTKEAPEPTRSRLARLVTQRPARSLIVILGAVCILIGLLPPADPAHH